MHLWVWIALEALVVLVIVEQLRIFKANREFRKKDEIFQVVTENAADMIALVDVKGRRLYNSPAYKRVLGYSPLELSETSSFEQIHPDDRMRVLEAAREARESGVGKRLEYRIKHRDGSWRVLESVASTIRDARGEVAKLVIVNRDITEPTAACSWTACRSPSGACAARQDEAMPCCWRMWITSRSSTKRWGPRRAITS